jgi:hypothetical protein
MQQLGKNVIAATNTQATTELLGHLIFYAVHVVSRKAHDWFLPELLVFTLSSSYNYSTIIKCGLILLGEQPAEINGM